ncbi:MAG: PTPA-CTERM sorting domain-containing protein [Synechococcales cyanobacterium C42_A2020_086]|jgi:hypothetical protein|nr:PTPA-CTERM sorting domain-containing protein [Synechococcales cyanobacterium C42_A2020_086]
MFYTSARKVSAAISLRWQLSLALCTAFGFGIMPPASAGLIRSGTDDTVYRQLSNDYPSVGRLALQYEGGGSGLCSGTLINSRWAVTAAHCLDGLTGVQSVDDTFAASAGSPARVSRSVFTVGGQNYGIQAGLQKSQWLLAPSGTSFWNFDIALLALDRPVLNVAPAQVNRNTGELSEIGVYVGFGKTGQGQQTIAGSEGTKRAGPNKIGSSYYSADPTGLPLMLGTDWDQPVNFVTGSGLRNDTFDGIPFPLPYEYHIQPGDSGGGLFIGGPRSSPVGPLTINAGSERLLAGVISHLKPRPGLESTPENVARYGSEAYSVRISPYADWIDTVINHFSTNPLPGSVGSLGSSPTSRGIGAGIPFNFPDEPNLFNTAPEFILVGDTFRSSFDSLLPLEMQTPEGNDGSEPQPIPTPTLLPGLIGLGVSVWRNKKRRSQNSEPSY